MPLVAALLLALLACFQDKPPSESECKRLVEDYLALDAFDADAEAERRAILARLRQAKPLSASKVRTWRKRVLSQAARGVELETSPGVHELADGRLYYLAGQTARPKGVLLHLHGRSAPAPKPIPPQNPFHLAALKRDWVVIWPRRLAGDEAWTDPGSERLVLFLLDAALRTFEVESDRVVLSGSSAGAIGAWSLAARHADRFAALTPFSGGPVALHRGSAPRDGVVPNLRNLPISQFQAVDDALTPVSMTRAADRSIAAARELWGGYAWHYHEVPGTKHGSPLEGCDPVYDPIEEARREACPARVVWQPSAGGPRRLYWLAWEEPRLGAVVVADLDPEENAVRVTTEGGASGLELLLSDDALDLDRELTVYADGAEVFRGEVARRLDVVVRTGARGDAETLFEASVVLP
ncbi:MAG: hypothetical protein AAF682_03400 [Planctomycetota bacterium]